MMETRKRRVTQQDIADSLGVSRITVSKALNGTGNITTEMQILVRAKAIELGYPKLLNRPFGPKEIPQLPKQRLTISLFTYLYCTTDSYWAPVMSGMATVLAEKGYDLSICFLSVPNRREVIFPNNFDQEHTAGIITLGNFTREHIDIMKKTKIPIVSLDTTCEYETGELFTDTIMSLNRQPMYHITSHLIELGHKKIGYIGQCDKSLTFRERWLGFRRAMAAHHLEINPKYCFIAEPGSAFNRQVVMEAMAQMTVRPTAYVCSNDETAIFILQFLRENNIRVPDQISVTGFDNINEAEVMGLTSVDVNKIELGMRASEELLWRIENPKRPYELLRVAAIPVFRDTSRNPAGMK